MKLKSSSPLTMAMQAELSSYDTNNKIWSCDSGHGWTLPAVKYQDCIVLMH